MSEPQPRRAVLYIPTGRCGTVVVAASAVSTSLGTPVDAVVTKPSGRDDQHANSQNEEND
jgi:hypothetical protein